MFPSGYIGKGPGDGDEDYCVSPEGTHIAMAFRRPQSVQKDDVTTETDPRTVDTNIQPQAKDMAWTTDTGIYLSKMSMDDKYPNAIDSPKLISGDARVYNKNPIFSPNGRYIAYLSMDRPGYESDKNSIKLYDIITETTTQLTLDGNQVIICNVMTLFM